MGDFEPSRGLRQGDPLSLYLFILCTDVLSCLLNGNGDVQGISIGRSSPAISHLLYADDLVLVGRATKRSAGAMRDCLEKCCSWSGQKVNQEKSSVMFSPNTHRDSKRKIKSLWGLKGLKGNLTYLGNSLVLSRNLTKEFSKLVDRVQARLDGW